MVYALMFGTLFIASEPTLAACEALRAAVIKQTRDHSEAGRIRICADLARFTCQMRQT